MALEKLTISPEDGDDIEVMFNPNSYTITKNVAWNRTNDARANAPSVTFGGGAARELALELFFDVTESTDDDPDVRAETSPIVELTQIMQDKERPRPPICTISWGDSGVATDFPFVGLVSHLAQKFTLFHSSGRPLRATLNVTFSEFLGRRDDLLKTDPELTTRTVRRGDDLPRIAAAWYGDATKWTVIATANRIENPFVLTVGTILTLPKR